MRIHIRHTTTYHYEQPAAALIQLLRVTPRSCENQKVRRWRIDLDHDGVLKSREDAFGNIVHMLSMTGPISSITIAADGEVDTIDTNGVVLGAVERFPPRLYLRETPLTLPSDDMRAFARDSMGDRSDLLASLHRLMIAINTEVRFDTAPTQVTTTAIEAFNMKSGVCQDLSHIFLACARSVGVPARYVGGYLWRLDGDARQQQDAGHAWAEAYIPDLGWVGFDPANGVSPTDAHVRIAIGLDYLGAAPVRGSRTGGPSEKLDVAVSITQAEGNSQS